MLREHTCFQILSEKFSLVFQVVNDSNSPSRRNLVKQEKYM